MITPTIRHSAEVAKALKAGESLVALESTIITHGMPSPQNVEVAREVEQTVRDQGAVPATIAVLDGELHIGLDDEQLEMLGAAKDVMKLSRADMAFAMATGKTGSTTVSATMIAARMAEIAVFATGGTGGVHPGAETSFDISADLTELARTPVIVVAAGPKAILDVAKTLEVLETQGVPVIGYQNKVLPAFWSRQGDHDAPLVVDNPKDIAATHLMRAELGLEGGMLVANPVPEVDDIPQSEMRSFIDRANKEAAERGVSGKALTPWLLARIFELTDGASLKTNISLVKNNARLAAEIALACHRLKS
ncbi:MAG: pseudouridine-5'-phosphate glycosidase [Pseudomonadota bacterium]